MKSSPKLKQGFYRPDSECWIPDTEVWVAHTTDEMARLLRTIRYVDSQGVATDARKGLVFDGGSKPRPTWPLVGHPYNKYLPCYAVHDQECDDIEALYTDGALTVSEARRTRRDTDWRFLDGMRWLKVNELGRAKNRIERAIVLIKHAAVRLQALFRLRQRKL